MAASLHMKKLKGKCWGEKADGYIGYIDRNK